MLTGHMKLHAPLGLQRVRLRIDATYAAHGANDQLKADLTTAFGQPADEHMKLFGIDANVEYPFASASGGGFAPSVFGGIGLWHSTVSVTVGSASTHTNATELAWQLGGEITRGPVFLELRYVRVAAAEGYPPTSFFPVSVGYRFGKRAP